MDIYDLISTRIDTARDALGSIIIPPPGSFLAAEQAHAIVEAAKTSAEAAKDIIAIVKAAKRKPVHG